MLFEDIFNSIMSTSGSTELSLKTFFKDLGALNLWKPQTAILHALWLLITKITIGNMKAIIIGAELGGAAGARAPPLLHNPRKFIVWGENSPKFPVPALY